MTRNGVNLDLTFVVMLMMLTLRYTGGGHGMAWQDEDNEYRLDGFVVGDEDDEDEDDGSDGGKRRRNKSGGDNKRKRLRKAREDHGMEVADDEDLELIREAQGVR